MTVPQTQRVATANMVADGQETESQAPHPRILIYEPEATGHQMDFVRFLGDAIRSALPEALITLLTTESAAGHPTCQALADRYGARLKIVVATEVRKAPMAIRLLGAFYARQWRNSEQLRRGLQNFGPETINFVILPHLEAIGLLALAARTNLLQGRKWAAITIGARFHHRQCGIAGPFQWQDIVQRILFNRLLREPSLVCLGAVNPYLASAVNSPKVCWCPEPAAEVITVDAAEARRSYGLRQETTVVLVFGFIDRRKCLGPLLEATASLDPSIDITIFLAGTQHASHVGPTLNGTAATSLRHRGRLVEANRFIMAGRDIDPMNVADIVWVFYEAAFVFTGSVLVRAARAGRPVIARQQGVIGKLVADTACGIVLPTESTRPIADALQTLAQQPQLRSAMGERGRRGFAQHTPAAFARPIVDSIVRAMARR